MTTRKYSSLSQQTTLTSAVTSGATVFPVVSATTLLGGITLAANEVFTVVIDPDTSLEEIIDITSGSGNPVSANNLTVVRGVDGSSAQQHSAGATIRHMIIGRDLREPNVHTSTGLAVHGLGATSSVVGTQDTQTLYNKTIVSPILTGTTENDSGMVFQGTTVDAYTTTLNVVDPTHNNTVTIPNTSGTVVLDTAAQTLTNKTITSPVITGIPTPSVSTDPANKAYVDAVAGSATAAAASATAAATSATSAAVSATSSANSATASATSAASALTSASSAATSASSAATSASSAAASVIAAQYTAVGDILQGTGAGTATKITIATTSGWQLQSNGTTAVWAAPAITPSSTSTVTNKDLTDSTNKINWPSVAGKNAIINGGMDIWQRGTSFAIANGTPQYTADRWTCYFNGTGTITQETSVIPSNSKYAIRLTATATSIDNRIFQIIETNNVLPYAGKAITISLQMAGTVGVAAGVTLTYSTSVDDSLYNILTSITLTTVTAPTLSNSLQTYVFTGTIPSTAKTLRVGIGTNGVVNTNYLVVANAQLELGSTATTFSRSGGSIGGELALCQRYYWRQNANAEAAFVIFGQGSATSTTVAYCQTPFPVQMRTKPTAIDFPTVATYFQALDAGAGGASLTALVFDSAQTTSQQGFLTATVAAGLTQFRPYVIRGNNSTGAYLGWTAEL